MLKNDFDEYVSKTRTAHARNRKDIFVDVLYAINLILFGVVIGIGLCKFCPEFWWFINWGISV